MTTTETERPVLSALDEIRERERTATPGPWRWWGNTGSQRLALATRGWGGQFVMTFQRFGMQSAQPAFAVGRTWKPDPKSEWDFQPGRLTPASDLAVYEVAPDATSRDDKRVYRADIAGIRHPDAEFIAHAREDIRVLLAGYDVLLDEHATRAMFLGAGDCDCGPMDGPMLERVHPMGDGDVGRICVLTQIDTYCKACTELECGGPANADEYVEAARCIVRPLIEEALAAAAA